MKTNTQMPQPMRSKRIVRNKTIIIITDVSDQEVREVLRLLDKERSLPPS